MSSYPGDDPQQPGHQPPADEPTDSEPTQPVGYWERLAAEERARQAGQPHPTTPYPQGYPGPGGPAAQNPYGAPPPPPPGGQVPPPPGQAGPQAPPAMASGPVWAASPPAGPPGPPPYAAYQPVAPDHPQSTLALVLGLVGLIGAFVFCGVPLLVSPFAWALGANALKEIRASQGRLGGESQARTGMILGIVGTVLAVLLLLAVVAFFVLVAVSATAPSGSSV